LIISLRFSILLRRRGEIGLVLKTNKWNKLSFLGLTTQELIEYIKIIAEFCSNHIDAILNCSILLTCLMLYINIPRVIRLLHKDNIEKDEKLESKESLESEESLENKEYLESEEYLEKKESIDK